MTDWLIYLLAVVIHQLWSFGFFSVWRVSANFMLSASSFQASLIKQQLFSTNSNHSFLFIIFRNSFEKVCFVLLFVFSVCRRLLWWLRLGPCYWFCIWNIHKPLLITETTLQISSSVSVWFHCVCDNVCCVIQTFFVSILAHFVC